ncbi:hypothetical protein B566_EDAN009483 [Ephemera danica]|nr:hypothetical protein B566_EDAN009483 [Ephemera danica]
MSDKPVAKRTRLSVSRLQTEDTCDAEEMQIELRMLHYNMISKCDEIIHELIPKMNQCINTTEDLATKPGIECQRQEIEFNINSVQSHVLSAQENLSVIKKVVDHILIERLHTCDCNESDECLLKMQRLLIRDPCSLERRADIRDVSGSLIDKRNCSPLHDAISKGHMKCIKFLLERGAKVTSIASFSRGTILHTLYIMRPMHHSSKYDTSTRRLAILKLLLKYGVSRVFQQKQSGSFALRMASILNEPDEVALLFQHGATMHHLETQSVILNAWKCYNLQLVKLFFLHYSHQFYIPGPQSLYQELIQHCYIKMVLPGVPLRLCHEKLLEALQLYKAFGGKFGVHPWKYPNHNLLRYLEGYKRKRHFTGVISRIKTLISNPLSLKEISRLVVFKCVCKDYVENIKKLEVHVDLQPFLRFDDVTITEKPDDFDGKSYYLSSDNTDDDEGSSSDVDDF